MSQISCKISSPFISPAGLSLKLESFFRLGLNQFSSLISCSCVQSVKKSALALHVSFAPANTTVCMTRRYFKRWLKSISPCPIVLWHWSRRNWKIDFWSLGFPPSVPKFTFSAISHSMADTFSTLAAVWRAVIPPVSLTWGSAPDCSNNWISEFGDPLPRAIIRGMVLLEVAGWLTSAPAWNKKMKTGDSINTHNVIQTGLILGLRPANERRRYKVMPSHIGWAQT